MPDMNEQDIIKTFEEIARFEPTEQSVHRDLTQVREMIVGTSRSFTPERRRIWKSVTKSRISRLATAASLIVAALILWHTLGRTGYVYAISDVPRLIAEAQTVHVRSWHFHNGNKMPSEYWCDLQSGSYYHYYEANPTSSGANGFEPATVIQRVSDGCFIMTVDHKKKSVRFEKLLASLRRLNSIKSREAALEIMFKDVRQLDSYTKVGEKEIEGQRFDIWQRQLRSTGSPMSFKYENWVSPDTGDVALTRMWHKDTKSNRDWTLYSETDLVERNAQPPQGIFSTDPPDGYTLENSKATAELAGVSFVPFDYIGGYRINVLLSFVLENGSVLACWNSVNRSVAPDPNVAFAPLETGDPLPQTPVALFGLISSPDMEGRQASINYVGTHILHTRKAGRIYEWALYVPEREVVSDGPTMHNIAVLKFNTPDPKLSGQMHTWSLMSLAVDAETFDTYFREAVLELSDDRTAPDNIDYENVLKLAGHIRGRRDLYDAFESELKEGKVKEHVFTPRPVEIVTPQQAMQQVKRRIEEFYAAIIEGRKEDAVKMLTYQEPRASRVYNGLRQLPGLGDIKPEEIYADDEKALVVSCEFEAFEGKSGRWAISVIREKGGWLIRDFDATTTERMAGEVEKFLKVAPQAQHFSVK